MSATITLIPLDELKGIASSHGASVRVENRLPFCKDVATLTFATEAALRQVQAILRSIDVDAQHVGPLSIEVYLTA